MWKFLLGPILLGAACLIGSIYGASAEQVVRKPPEVVRAAVSQMVSGRHEGSVMLESGKPLAFALELDRISDEQMLVRITMNGKQASETGLSFTPRDDGKATLVTAATETDGAVLREALAGTPQAKLGYAPDWLFNLTIRPVLREFAEEIERGGALRDPMQGFRPQAEWEAQLPPEKQRAVQEWRQYEPRGRRSIRMMRRGSI